MLPMKPMLSTPPKSISKNKYTHAFVLILMILFSFFTYIITKHGQDVTLQIKKMDLEFITKVEKVMSQLEYMFLTDSLNSKNQIFGILSKVMTENTFIHQIYFLADKHNYVITRNDTSLEITNQDVNILKNTKEWYTVSLVKPEWSEPYYESKDGDRSYLLHYTSNVLNVISGQVDAIINISCKSKLRRRNQIAKF